MARIPVKLYNGVLSATDAQKWAYYTNLRIYILTGNHKDAIKAAQQIDAQEQKETQQP